MKTIILSMSLLFSSLSLAQGSENSPLLGSYELIERSGNCLDSEFGTDLKIDRSETGLITVQQVYFKMFENVPTHHVLYTSSENGVDVETRLGEIFRRTAIFSSDLTKLTYEATHIPAPGSGGSIQTTNLATFELINDDTLKVTNQINRWICTFTKM